MRCFWFSLSFDESRMFREKLTVLFLIISNCVQQQHNSLLVCCFVPVDRNWWHLADRRADAVMTACKWWCFSSCVCTAGYDVASVLHLRTISTICCQPESHVKHFPHHWPRFDPSVRSEEALERPDGAVRRRDSGDVEAFRFKCTFCLTVWRDTFTLRSASLPFYKFSETFAATCMTSVCLSSSFIQSSIQTDTSAEPSSSSSLHPPPVCRQLFEHSTEKTLRLWEHAGVRDHFIWFEKAANLIHWSF